MYKVKQISKPAKNSRYNTYIPKRGSINKTNYRPISILPTVQKFSEEYYSINYNVFQINFFRFCSVGSGKGTVLSICPYNASPKMTKMS